MLTLHFQVLIILYINVVKLLCRIGTISYKYIRYNDFPRTIATIDATEAAALVKNCRSSTELSKLVFHQTLFLYNVFQYTKKY